MRVVIVMVIIATVSRAATMFQLLVELMYACYPHLPFGEEEGLYAFSRKLAFGRMISF